MKPDTVQMQAFLSHAMPPGTCLELRVFRARWTDGYIKPADQFTSTYAGWYDDPRSLMVDAGKVRGLSVFVTLNPVNPALLGRSCNKIVKCKNATKDEDISCLRWLYLDIDPVRPADISSNQAELDLAIERRDLILLENPEIARSAISGISGNGCFIFVRLPDYPNDNAHRKIVADSVNLIAGIYSDDRVKLDTTTKNPARITCLPGSWKCKGDSLPDRPHRLARIDRGL